MHGAAIGWPRSSKPALTVLRFQFLTLPGWEESARCVLICADETERQECPVEMAGAALGASAIEEMAGQHREILSHMLNRRWAKARKALSNHIRAQQPASMHLVAKLTARARNQSR